MFLFVFWVYVWPNTRSLTAYKWSIFICKNEYKKKSVNIVFKINELIFQLIFPLNLKKKGRCHIFQICYQIIVEVNGLWNNYPQNPTQPVSYISTVKCVNRFVWKDSSEILTVGINRIILRAFYFYFYLTKIEKPILRNLCPWNLYSL